MLKWCNDISTLLTIAGLAISITWVIVAGASIGLRAAKLLAEGGCNFTPSV